MIAVIDYGMGNLRSISKAIAYVGGDVLVTRDPEEIRKADRLFLPGVGAFGQGIANLRSFGLIPVLEEEILRKRKPFWGICLGMQLLATSSEEFGRHSGLNWMPAEVKLFEFPKSARLNVPHVGWNSVRFLKDHPVTGSAAQADFYFVHSYYVQLNIDDLTVGTCDYGGEFTACCAMDNIFATQFHPEKSQEAGLDMLANFCRWKPC